MDEGPEQSANQFAQAEDLTVADFNENVSPPHPHGSLSQSETPISFNITTPADSRLKGGYGGGLASRLTQGGAGGGPEFEIREVDEDQKSSSLEDLNESEGHVTDYTHKTEDQEEFKRGAVPIKPYQKP